MPRKLSLYLMLLLCPYVNGYAATIIPDEGTKGNFSEFARRIEKQTGFTIAYPANDIHFTFSQYPDIEGLSAEEALRKVLDTKIYSIVTVGNHVIVKRKKPSVQTVPPAIADSPEAPAAQVEEPDYIKVSDMPAGTVKIPPPSQSVYSDQTRLIIILDSARHRPVPPTATPPRSMRDSLPVELPSGNEPTGSKVPASEDKITAGEELPENYIPFRYDLLEKEVFIAPADKKRKKNRRSRK